MNPATCSRKGRTYCRWAWRRTTAQFTARSRTTVITKEIVNRGIRRLRLKGTDRPAARPASDLRGTFVHCAAIRTSPSGLCSERHRITAKSVDAQVPVTQVHEGDHDGPGDRVVHSRPFEDWLATEVGLEPQPGTSSWHCGTSGAAGRDEATVLIRDGIRRYNSDPAISTALNDYQQLPWPGLR